MDAQRWPNWGGGGSGSGSQPTQKDNIELSIAFKLENKGNIDNKTQSEKEQDAKDAKLDLTFDFQQHVPTGR